uniref:RNase H type-1 domain-containing protein n=1 Tax=Fagus sylvatica TaxID=28930 RepID=A0A2N9EWR9_FAGSY
MFESDSQICINAVTLASFKPPWRIHGLILDIEAATKHIPGSAFNWVYREANEAAHQLANWSLKNAFVGSFDLNHAPSSFISIISNEAVSSSIV